MFGPTELLLLLLVLLLLLQLLLQLLLLKRRSLLLLLLLKVLLLLLLFRIEPIDSFLKSNVFHVQGFKLLLYLNEKLIEANPQGRGYGRPRRSHRGQGGGPQPRSIVVVERGFSFRS